MKRVRPTLVAAALACLLPAAAFAAATDAQNQTETVHRVVPMGSNGTLKLHNFSGTVTITGADVQNVTVDAVRRAPQDRLDRIKLDIQSDGSTVTIEANKRGPESENMNNNVVETDFEIQVPRDAVLDIDVFSSPVTVSGVTGRQDVKSFSGGLTLRDVASPTKAKTFSGKIDMELAGYVTQPELDLETFSGAIDLTVPSGAGAAVDLDTFSGGINSEVPLTVRSQSRRQLKGDLGQPGSGRLKVKTFSGAVRIK